MPVTIEILEPFQGLVSANRLQLALETVLAQEGAFGDVTLLIADDATIADLNRRFLGQDSATDVLSFPAQSDEASTFVLPPDLDPYLGDIIVAYPYAQRQAQSLGREVGDEIELLAVHGALHLLGYDHADPADEAAMWARQEAVLRDLRILRRTCNN